MAEIQTIVDSGLFVLIWLVQLIIYPSFRYIAEKDFIGWHNRYTGLMGLIVAPLMLFQVGVEVVQIAQDAYRPPRLVMIAAIWLSTCYFSVPCHRRLHRQGKDIAIIRRLVRRNWPRTMLWSLIFLETVLWKHATS